MPERLCPGVASCSHGLAPPRRRAGRSGGPAQAFLRQPATAIATPPVLPFHKGAEHLQKWTPDSWRPREAKQQPKYPDAGAVEVLPPARGPARPGARALCGCCAGCGPRSPVQPRRPELPAGEPGGAAVHAAPGLCRRVQEPAGQAGRLRRGRGLLATRRAPCSRPAAPRSCCAGSRPAVLPAAWRSVLGSQHQRAACGRAALVQVAHQRRPSRARRCMQAATARRALPTSAPTASGTPSACCSKWPSCSSTAAACRSSRLGAWLASSPSPARPTRRTLAACSCPPTGLPCSCLLVSARQAASHCNLHVHKPLQRSTFRGVHGHSWAQRTASEHP